MASVVFFFPILLLLCGFLLLIKMPFTPASSHCHNLLISILYQGACVGAAEACVRARPRQKERVLLHPARRHQQSDRRQQIRCHSIQSRDNDLELGRG